MTAAPEREGETTATCEAPRPVPSSEHPEGEPPLLIPDTVKARWTWIPGAWW